MVTFWGVCQKVTRRKGGKVSERRHSQWICSPSSEPTHELLAFGFWLLAFKKGTYPFAMAAPTHLSALTAGYFGLGQSNQNRPLPSSGPYAALRGSLAPALLPGGPRPRPIHGPKRLPGILPVTSLRKTSARPPEVAICVVWTIARLEAKARAKARARARARARAS